MENYPKLYGKLVNLCVPRIDDYAISLYTHWLNDSRISHWIGHNSQVDTPNKLVRSLQTLNQYQYLFTIVCKSTDTIIGLSEIRYEPIVRNATLSIFIGDTTMHGQGFGTEAINLMVRYAFQELCAHRVGLTTHSDNTVAIKCFKKAGFVFCGNEHDAVFHNGRYVDRLHAEIIKS